MYSSSVTSSHRATTTIDDKLGPNRTPALDESCLRLYSQSARQERGNDQEMAPDLRYLLTLLLLSIKGTLTYEGLFVRGNLRGLGVFPSRGVSLHL